MGGSIFLTLFFGLFIAVGVGILGFGLHSLNMSRQGGALATTPGTITQSDFTTSTDSDGDTTFRTKIAYPIALWVARWPAQKSHLVMRVHQAGNFIAIFMMRCR